MMRAGAALVLASVLSLSTVSAALAVNPEEQLPNPRQEARARAISRELRCVVCQSQTIDDSSAPVAQALRKLVRDRIVAGDSDDQVVSAVTARYGDFVLLKPPFEWSTSILWLGPFAVLGLGAAGAVIYVRRQEALPQAPPPLTEAERDALAETLTALTLEGSGARDRQSLEIVDPLHPPPPVKRNFFVGRVMSRWPGHRG
jgi:cytochrome c-type biogenesis protein CcmH